MLKPNVAVIGCGFFGSMHAQIYSQMYNVNLLFVVDSIANNAKALADKLGCNYSDNYKEIIERNDIDIIDVCVPDSMHTEIVFCAIKNNKHILIEKPLADTLENAEKMLNATTNYDKKTMVGHICRFDIRNEKAFESIQNKEIGDVIYISAKRNSPTLGAHRYANTCKLLTHSGVHDMDLVRWFLNSEYKSVYAVGRKLRMESEGYKDTLDSIQAIFTFENGVTFSLENTWALPDKFPRYIDSSMNIVGTKGSISIDFGNQGYNLYTNNDCIYEDVSYWVSSFGQLKGDLSLELNHFIECVIHDKQPRVSIYDGYQVACAAVKALESAEKGELLFI